MTQMNPASSLTDEELDAALEELGIPNEDPGNSKEEEEAGEKKSEEAPKKDPEDPAGEAEDPKEEEGEEEAKKPSRREQLRVMDLLHKYPPLAKDEPKKGEPAPRNDAFDYDKDMEADPELKAKLAADRKAAEDAAYERGRSESGKSLAEEKASLLFHTRLEIDAPKVEAKYPVLDKDSDKFNPALAKAINTMYLEKVGYNQETDTVTNPNIRYSDYTEAMFELGDVIASSKLEETKKEVTRQAAQTGLRPNGGSKAKLDLNKEPHQMTDEELDAVIAQMIPSK